MDLSKSGVKTPMWARPVSFADAQVMYNEKILGGIKNIFFDGPSGESIELFDYMK